MRHIIRLTEEKKSITNSNKAQNSIKGKIVIRLYSTKTPRV